METRHSITEQVLRARKQTVYFARRQLPTEPPCDPSAPRTKFHLKTPAGYSHVRPSRPFSVDATHIVASLSGPWSKERLRRHVTPPAVSADRDKIPATCPSTGLPHLQYSFTCPAFSMSHRRVSEAFFTLFCGLFSGARLYSEWLISRNLQGNHRGLIDTAFRNFPRGTGKDHEKFSVGVDSVPAMSRTEHL
jgi:hypothetical protein